MRRNRGRAFREEARGNRAERDLDDCHAANQKAQQDLESSEALRVQAEVDLAELKARYNQLAQRINANKTVLSLLGISRVELIT